MQKRRYVSLWFRYLLTDWLTLRRPELLDVPFILVESVQNRLIITAANALAEQEGVTVGMAAADAKALIYGLQVIDAVPGQAAKILKAAAEWCIRYSPLIAIDLPYGLILDVSGCAHLWGGEQEYLEAIILTLYNKGYHVRGAMADTVGAAWGVARYGKAQTIVPTGKQAEAMMPLPPPALRLEQVIADRLHKLGFYTIQKLGGWQRSALRRRLGDGFLLRMDQALGRVDEPLLFINPVQPYYEHLPCLEPVSTVPAIEMAIKDLLARLCQRLQGEGKGVRNAVLTCYRVDGKVLKVNIGTNKATHHTGHLFKLFELKIATIEPALGIELFTLEAPRVDIAEQEQEVLWQPEGCAVDHTALAQLLDRLGGKIGAEHIKRYLPHESYWPERSLKQAASLTQQPATAWRTGSIRPSLLLAYPEVVEVMALLPDNPPVFFIYKGKRHSIVKADLAERIEPEWWNLTPQPHRDYYVVEDDGGRRYWLFRAGHYSSEGTQWFIHGFFA